MGRGTPYYLQRYYSSTAACTHLFQFYVALAINSSSFRIYNSSKVDGLSSLSIIIIQIDKISDIFIKHYVSLSKMNLKRSTITYKIIQFYKAGTISVRFCSFCKMIKQEGKSNSQGPSKKTAKAIKIVTKFEEQLEACQKLILSKDISKAIERLKGIIIKYKNLGIYEFKGVGNVENWNGQFGKGPLEWFSKALEKEWIEGNPFDLLSVCFAIQLHTKKECIEHMIKYYSDLIGILSRREQILMGMANIYYNNEQYKDAEALYLQILSGHSQCPKVYEYMAWICYRFKRKTKALFYCEKYLGRQSSVGMQLLKIIAGDSKNEQKIKQIEQMAISNPEYYRLYVQLGNFFKDIETSIKYYEKARGYGYKESEIESKIAMVYLQKNKWSQAQNHLQKAQKLEKNYLFYKALAKRQLKNENYQKAIDYYEEAANISPYTFKIYEQIGYNYFYNMKDYPEAVKYFTKYINLNPYNSKIYSYIGRSFEAMNEFGRAQEYFNKALQLNPKQISALRYQADHSFNEKRYIKALQQYTRGNHIYPNDVLFCEGVFDCYQRLKCIKEADEWAHKCTIEGSPAIRKRFLRLLGDIKFKDGYYVDAMRCYLEHENIIENLSVNWLKKKINSDNNLDSNLLSQLKPVLKEVGKRIPQDENHQYAIVLLAQLYSIFKLQAESHIWYEKAVELHRRRLLKQDIVDLLMSKKVIVKFEVKEETK